MIINSFIRFRTVLNLNIDTISWNSTRYVNRSLDDIKIIIHRYLPTYMKASQETPKVTEKFLKKICLYTKILKLHITHVRKYIQGL